jgi:HSP20 family molecular chaperone IbpA
MAKPGLPGSPFFLGFDEIERLVEFASRGSAEAFPPLNIEQFGGGSIRITIAVAGFEPENLAVTLCDRELTVRGERKPPGEGKAYLHKGIAERSFTRSFALASSIEVVSASLSNGLLRIRLQQNRRIPQTVQVPITVD